MKNTSVRNKSHGHFLRLLILGYQKTAIKNPAIFKTIQIAIA